MIICKSVPIKIVCTTLCITLYITFSLEFILYLIGLLINYIKLESSIDNGTQNSINE